MSGLGPHAAFIIGAYGVAIGSLIVMAVSSWRRALTLEQAAETLRAKRRQAG
jgi:heme exporter protein D